MNKIEIEHLLQHLKTKNNIRVFTPYKYFKGLNTPQEITSRFWDIVEGSKSDDKNTQSYKPFQTDLTKSTKKSKYTIAFEKQFGTNAKSLQQKSKVSGVPLDIITKVYNKGKAAWRTGHRVGANEEQWGYARVHSFLTLGCTAFSADFSLLKEAVSRMDKNNLKKFFCQNINCPKSTLKKAYYEKIGAKEVIDRWIHEFCKM